jgi:hypothetical protein
VAHSISPPLLLVFSSPFVLTIRLLAARICEAFFVSEEEEEEEEGKFWRVFSFEQAKRQKSLHRFPNVKTSPENQKHFANNILQLMATEIKKQQYNLIL